MCILFFIILIEYFLVPEETEIPSDPQKPECRNAFSSPQERTELTEYGTIFGKSAMKQKNLSQCLLLGPQNLEKIFDNKQIIENSQTLFLNTGYFTSQLNTSNFQSPSISVNEQKKRILEDVIANLNSEDEKYEDNKIKELLNELYDFMEKDNLINSKVSSKLRVLILKCLYKFVESKNEEILIDIAKIILAVSNIL